jgi:hypothetical protein
MENFNSCIGANILFGKVQILSLSTGQFRKSTVRQ